MDTGLSSHGRSDVANYGWVGWILTVIGLLVGYIYFRANRKIQRIEWWVVSDQLLIPAAIAEGLNPDVAVTVGGDTVKQPRIFELKIRNTGTVSLRMADMDGSFHVRVLGPGTRALRMTTTKLPGPRSSAAAETEYDYLSHGAGDIRYMVPTFLLNPGDSVALQLLLDGDGGEISIQGEADGYTIRQTDGPGETLNTVTLVALAAMSGLTGVNVNFPPRRRGRGL